MTQGQYERHRVMLIETRNKESMWLQTYVVVTGLLLFALAWASGDLPVQGLCLAAVVVALAGSALSAIVYLQCIGDLDKAHAAGKSPEMPVVTTVILVASPPLAIALIVIAAILLLTFTIG